MKRFLCILLGVIFLVSCSGEKREAVEILYELMEDHSPLPKGEIYTRSAEIGSDGYASDAMLRSMYGEDAESVFATLSDYAIYMSSFAEPYEIAVLLCYSNTDAIRAERMCRERADILAVAFRRTEYHELYKNIRVNRKGKRVTFEMVGNDLSKK